MVMSQLPEWIKEQIEKAKEAEKKYFDSKLMQKDKRHCIELQKMFVYRNDEIYNEIRKRLNKLGYTCEELYTYTYFKGKPKKWATKLSVIDKECKVVIKKEFKGQSFSNSEQQAVNFLKQLKLTI